MNKDGQHVFIFSSWVIFWVKHWHLTLVTSFQASCTQDQVPAHPPIRLSPEQGSAVNQQFTLFLEHQMTNYNQTDEKNTCRSDHIEGGRDLYFTLPAGGSVLAWLFGSCQTVSAYLKCYFARCFSLISCFGYFTGWAWLKTFSMCNHYCACWEDWLLGFSRNFGWELSSCSKRKAAELIMFKEGRRILSYYFRVH